MKKLPIGIPILPEIINNQYIYVDKTEISNGILEVLNSIFQAAKAKAMGYKKTDALNALIYILTGKLDFAKVNPYYRTHLLL